MTRRAATQETLQTTLLDAPSYTPTDPLSLAERAARWGLWSIEGIGPKRMEQAIWQTQGQVSRLWRSVELAAKLSAKWRLSAKQRHDLETLLRHDPLHLYQQELERLPPNTRLIYWRDEAYPRRLLSLPDPPSFIYVQGALEPLRCAPLAALIGSREISPAHAAFAQSLSASLGALGVSIISGGALGMDAAAHQGALDAQAYTAALLPSGLLERVPRSHAALFNAILAQGGALISEYPTQVVAKRYHFPRRNRLIAAITDATVVLKANAQGGSMITAQAALSLGRPVGVVPYEASDQRAAGSLELLKRAETFLVQRAQDVLHALQPTSGVEPQSAPTPRPPLNTQVSAPPPPELAGLERQIFDALHEHQRLDPSPMSAELLGAQLGCAVRELQIALTSLELDDLIARSPSGAGFVLR